MTDVSFIIPSFNSYKTIGRTLESIFQLKSFECVKEVIVVDSSMDGETRKLLRENSRQLKVVLLEKKTSPALGRNRGVLEATGALLCFIDSDVYLDEYWLENILKAYENGFRAGGGSVSVPDFQGKSQLALAQFYLQFNESIQAGPMRPVSMVPACNMFMEKELFQQAGGFPDIRASEDVLLCLKVGEKTPLWFVPEARCFHIFREDPRSYFNNQKVLGKYIIIYRRMKYPKWYYQGLWPVLLLPAFVCIKMIRIKSRIYKAGWGHYKKFLGCSFLFLAGLYYWSVGFMEGCAVKENA